MNEENKEVQVTETENQQGGVRKNLRLRHKLMLAMVAAMCMAASASAESPATGMANVMAHSTNVTTLLGLVFDFITGNALLATFVLFGLVGAAVRLFRRGKRAAR